jgi:hypothetical protein
MSKQLPGYYLFEKHYTKIDVDADNASTIAGLKKRVVNACAVRLSYAFNHISGHQIPSSPKGVSGNVWKGLNGNYILGSLGFARYLTAQYGTPATHKPSVHLTDYRDRRGMIFYDVRGWANAYGHVALWDGTKGWRGEFFKEARKVWFWEMASGPGALISAEL